MKGRNPRQKECRNIANDQLLLKRNQFNFSWEKSEAEGYSLADLGRNLIRIAVRRGVEGKRMPEQALQEKIPKLLETFEVFYNRIRLHSANGYLPPAEYERRFQAA